MSRLSSVIPLPSNSNPHSNQSVQGLQSFPEKTLSLGLERTTYFKSGRKQPIRALTSLISYICHYKSWLWVPKTRYSRSEEGDTPCQRYYSRLTSISLSFSLNSHSNQRVQGLQSYSTSIQLKPTLKPECPGYPESFGKSSKPWTRTLD